MLSLRSLLVAALLWCGVLSLHAQTTVVITGFTDEDDGPGSLADLDDISMREAVNHAPAGSTITVNFARFVPLTLGPLVIDRDLIIDGRSQFAPPEVRSMTRIETRNGPQRLIEIRSGANVTLKNFRLIGGVAEGASPDDRGGAIYNNESILTLERCVLVDNTAEFGGAIYCFSDDEEAVLNLVDTVIANNTAEFGGGIYCEGDRRNATLDFTGSTISGNSARIGGGLYCRTERRDRFLTLENCTFARNTASDRGGAIYSDANDRADVNISLEHCTVADNAADIGAGLYNNATDEADIILSFEDSIIAGNRAPSSPDLHEEGDATTTLTTSVDGGNLFTSLEGSTLVPGSAGLQVVSDPLLSALAEFGGPTPVIHPLADSPAILSGTSSRIDQRGFDLTGPETLGSVKTGPVTIVNQLGDDPNASTTLRKAIADNIATPAAIIRFAPALDGQTITLTEGQLKVADPSGMFIDASSLAGGIVINANGDATGESGFFFRRENSTDFDSINFYGITIEGSSARRAVDTVETALLLDHCVLRDNSAGGLTNTSGTVLLNACEITNNAAINGAGLVNSATDDFNGDGVMVVRDCTLTGNVAEARGGAINTGAARGAVRLRVEDSDVSGNSAGDRAGAMYVSGSESSSDLQLIRSSFSDNAAESGGAFYFELGQTDSTLAMDDCTVADNTALLGGGAIYALVSDAGLDADLRTTTLSGNTTSGRGGAVYAFCEVADVFFDFFNSTLANNTADEGGAFFAEDSNAEEFRVNFVDTTVAGNMALVSGGGVHGFIADPGFFDFALGLENSILAGNTAPFAPDYRAEGNIPFTGVGNNLFSSLQGSGLTAGTSGVTLVSDPLLSPLGNFGGLTETKLPLPGSPALDASTSSRTIDQRGFDSPLDGDNDGTAAADIGSTEAPNWSNPGVADYPSIWATDLDGDGLPWGLEQAIGANPNQAQPGDPAKLPQLQDDAPSAVVRFGRNAAAVAGTHWVLQRAPDLFSFEPLLSYDGSVVDFAIPGSGVDLSDPSFIQVTEPGEQNAFYRLDAVYRTP